MFRVGILYAVQDLLQMANNSDLTDGQFEEIYPRYSRIHPKDILEVAIQCNWLKRASGGKLTITGTGETIAAEKDPQARLRLQLTDILRISPPPWLGLLQQGRKAITQFGQPNVIQCFLDAGLLDTGDPSVATWWDAVATTQRSAHDARLLDIGRRGEWLSFKYEDQRVGRTPSWAALDDSTLGYDLLSSVSWSDSASFVIEVKASERTWDRATFTLSRHEWNVLHTQRRAAIHLWSLATDPPTFACLTVEALVHHVPVDIGSGQWQHVQMPFRITQSADAEQRQ